MDFVIDQANARGMQVALVPIWAHGQVGSLLTKDNATAYGQWIGTRYRDKKVAWMLGGDHDADGHEDIWRQLALGIAEGVTGRADDFAYTMMTYHPRGGSSSTSGSGTTPG